MNGESATMVAMQHCGLPHTSLRKLIYNQEIKEDTGLTWGTLRSVTANTSLIFGTGHMDMQPP